MVLVTLQNEQQGQSVTRLGSKVRMRGQFKLRPHILLQSKVARSQARPASL